jgi:hypothetical protein
MFATLLGCIDARRKESRTMTQDQSRGSAKIYQFPAGGRAGLRSHRDDVVATASHASQGIAKVVCGSAWYHEEAIAQDAPPRS